jgi:hypothetical protein
MNISREILRDAIAVYLQCAYPGGQIPAIVQQRISLDETRPVGELLASTPFENYIAEAPFHCTVYALRLGSADYPNVKMEIRPFPNHLGFVFWVNTHDHFVTISPGMPDADGWRDVVRRNRDLKQAVERAWAARKLPTFTSAMQEDLVERSDS